MKKLIFSALVAMATVKFYEYYHCDIPDGITQPGLMEFSLFFPKLSHDMVSSAHLKKNW